MYLIDLIVREGLAGSRGDARRLILMGGVRYNGEAVQDSVREVEARPGDVLEVGAVRVTIKGQR